MKYLTHRKSDFYGKSEQGQSLLEMAFALVILLLLVAGIVDLGRLFFTWVAIRDAAQEGAAYASVCPPNGPGNAQQIRDHIKGSSHFPVDLSQPNVLVASGFTDQPTPGSQVFVIVTYTNFEFVMPILPLFIPGGSLDIPARADDVSLQFECPK
ncbi:MAG: pilus assembly protein [Anaerolineae bacterium]|nr:pilus assembly protein [Anaerolineae bacterium]